MSARFCSKNAQRSSFTTPSSRPMGVRRRSALSSRNSRRCSARLVNMRYGSRRIDAGNNALGSCFLVTRGAIDLPGEVQPRHELRLQGGLEVPRIEVVVLDG